MADPTHLVKSYKFSYKITCYFDSFLPYFMLQKSIQFNFSIPLKFIMNPNLNLMKTSMEI
jgi:hypothetical protein